MAKVMQTSKTPRILPSAYAAKKAARKGRKRRDSAGASAESDSDGPSPRKRAKTTNKGKAKARIEDDETEIIHIDDDDDDDDDDVREATNDPDEDEDDGPVRAPRLRRRRADPENGDDGTTPQGRLNRRSEQHRVIDDHWPLCSKCNKGPTLDELERIDKLKSPKKKAAKTLRPGTDRHAGPVEGYAETSSGDETPSKEEMRHEIERKGGWLRCNDCTAPLHWGCLGLRRRKAILADLNAHAPKSKPVQEIAADVEREDIPCETCYISPALCYICKLDTVGRTEEDALEMWGQEDEDDPTLGDYARPVFRCMRCRRTAHYECLVDKPGENEHGAAWKVQYDYGSNCLDCHRWGIVDEIIAWRYQQGEAGKKRKRKSTGNAEKDQVDADQDELKRREFLVKFEQQSFRKVAWVPYAWIFYTSHPKLQHFLKQGTRLELEPISDNRDRVQLTTDAINQANLMDQAVVLKQGKNVADKESTQVDGETDVLMMLRGPPRPDKDAESRIPAAWRLPERILDVYFDPRILEDEEEATTAISRTEHRKKKKMLRGDSGAPPLDISGLIYIDELEGTIHTIPSSAEESFPHISYALVKWGDQGYEKCTWQNFADLVEENDEQFVSECKRAFVRYLNGRDVLVRKPTAADRAKRESRSQTPFTPLKTQPKWLEGGKLFDFQLEGLNWLRYGWHQQQPGILADEMGLGKTVQIISFIGSLYYREELSPFIIVVPNSTLPNWVREFEKWLPALQVVPYYGSEQARKIIERFELFHSSPPPDEYQMLKADVVIVSDTTMRLDPGPVARVMGWELLVVDEGHNLKSGSSNLLHKTLSQLDTHHRILLTGTPLNNNVGELFNLLHFLSPDKWQDIGELKAKYDILTPELIENLQPRLKPFFLRRVKSQVLSLPPKEELIVRVSLRPLQKKLYKSILEKNVKDIQALTFAAQAQGKKRRIAPGVLNVLMQLRKCCQHAYLVNPLLADLDDKQLTKKQKLARLIDASGKLSFLKMLLPKLKAQGHRVLLFSQFVINLELVEDFVVEMGYKYLRLDGVTGTKHRQKGIDAFNAPNSPYFIYLLSTRSGGVGINLTSADTVILFDPDFNPHVDLQAIARAHRIGQTKNVLCLTLVAKATAEEKIIENAKRKLVLDHLVVQNLENEESRPEVLESALKFGAQALFEENGVEENDRDIKFTDDDLEAILQRRNGKEAPKDIATASQSEDALGNAFSFARVWEQHDGALSPENTREEQDFWQNLIQQKDEESARLEQQKQEELAGPRKRKQLMANLNENALLRAQISQAGAEDDDADNSTSRKRPVRTADEDEDFVPQDADDQATVIDAEDDAISSRDMSRDIATLKDSQGPASKAQRPKSSSRPSVKSLQSLQMRLSANLSPALDSPRVPAKSQPSAEGVSSGEGIASWPPSLLTLELLQGLSKDRIGKLSGWLQNGVALPPVVAYKDRPSLTPGQLRYFAQHMGFPEAALSQIFSVIPEDEVPEHIRNLPNAGLDQLDLQVISNHTWGLAYHIFARRVEELRKAQQTVPLPPTNQTAFAAAARAAGATAATGPSRALPAASQPMSNAPANSSAAAKSNAQAAAINPAPLTSSHAPSGPTPAPVAAPSTSIGVARAPQSVVSAGADRVAAGAPAIAQPAPQATAPSDAASGLPRRKVVRAKPAKRSPRASAPSAPVPTPSNDGASASLDTKEHKAFHLSALDLLRWKAGIDILNVPELTHAAELAIHEPDAARRAARVAQVEANIARLTQTTTSVAAAAQNASQHAPTNSAPPPMAHNGFGSAHSAHQAHPSPQQPSPVVTGTATFQPTGSPQDASGPGGPSRAFYGPSPPAGVMPGGMHQGPQPGAYVYYGPISWPQGPPMMFGSPVGAPHGMQQQSADAGTSAQQGHQANGSFGQPSHGTNPNANARH